MYGLYSFNSEIITCPNILRIEFSIYKHHSKYDILLFVVNGTSDKRSLCVNDWRNSHTQYSTCIHDNKVGPFVQEPWVNCKEIYSGTCLIRTSWIWDNSTQPWNEDTLIVHHFWFKTPEIRILIGTTYSCPSSGCPDKWGYSVNSFFPCLIHINSFILLCVNSSITR